MKKNNEENAFVRFINGKGFYIVLLVCLICVGVSGLVIVNNTGFFNASITRREEVDSTPIPPPATAPPVNNPTKVPVMTAAPETKAPATQAPLTKAPETKAPATKAPTPAPKKVLYVKPVSGKIIEGYDAEELVFSSTMGDWRVHLGVDVAASVGTQVKACADGTVCDVGYDELKGFFVSISHPNDIYSVYYNLSSQILVAIDDEVKAGAVIGGVGESAAFEEMIEPHLHFEMIKSGENINPGDYISGY